MADKFVENRPTGPINQADNQVLKGQCEGSAIRSELQGNNFRGQLLCRTSPAALGKAPEPEAIPQRVRQGAAIRCQGYARVKFIAFLDGLNRPAYHVPEPQSPIAMDCRDPFAVRGDHQSLHLSLMGPIIVQRSTSGFWRGASNSVTCPVAESQSRTEPVVVPMARWRLSGRKASTGDDPWPLDKISRRPASRFQVQIAPSAVARARARLSEAKVTLVNLPPGQEMTR